MAWIVKNENLLFNLIGAVILCLMPNRAVCTIFFFLTAHTLSKRVIRPRIFFICFAVKVNHCIYHIAKKNPVRHAIASTTVNLAFIASSLAFILNDEVPKKKIGISSN